MFDVTLLILLGLAALGFISHNTTVAVSILVLIIVRCAQWALLGSALCQRTRSPGLCFSVLVPAQQ